MPKSRRARSQVITRPAQPVNVKRDTARITRRRLLYSTYALKNNKKQNYYILPLLPVEDNRLFNPTRSLARSTSGSRALLTYAGQKTTKAAKKYTPFSPWVAFENPRRVITCVRRKIRKEVIHALQIRGGRGNVSRKRTYSRNFKSEIRC